MTKEQTLDFIVEVDVECEFVTYLTESIDSNLTVEQALTKWLEQYDFSGDSDEEKLFALMEQTTEDADTCKDYIGNEDWCVYAEEEAEEAFEEYMENYIDDCILPSIPVSLQNYFDDEKFKKDMEMDGKGSALGSYDGEEYEQTVNGTMYFLYRNN